MYQIDAQEDNESLTSRELLAQNGRGQIPLPPRGEGVSGVRVNPSTDGGLGQLRTDGRRMPVPKRSRIPTKQASEKRQAALMQEDKIYILFTIRPFSDQVRNDVTRVKSQKSCTGGQGIFIFGGKNFGTT